MCRGVPFFIDIFSQLVGTFEKAMSHQLKVDCDLCLDFAPEFKRFNNNIKLSELGLYMHFVNEVYVYKYKEKSKFSLNVKSTKYLDRWCSTNV